MMIPRTVAALQAKRRYNSLDQQINDLEHYAARVLADGDAAKAAELAAPLEQMRADRAAWYVEMLRLR